MAIIDIAKSKPETVRLSSTSRSSGDGEVTIDAVNKKLAEALKEKKACEELQHIADGSIQTKDAKRLDFTKLSDYVTNVAGSNESELQKIFGAETIGDLFKAVLSSSKKKLENLVTSLVSFIGATSEKRQGIFNKELAQFFTTQDGGISIHSEDFSSLKEEKKLSALIKAAQKMGLAEAVNKAKSSINDLGQEGPKLDMKAVRVEIEKKIKSLGSTLDSNGNITRDGKAVVMAFDITTDDITKAFGSKYAEKPPVREGKLKWNEFLSKTWELANQNSPKELVEYVNGVLALHNSKLRESRSNATSADAKAIIDDQAKYLTDLLTGVEGNLPEGLTKAFEKAMKFGPFLTDAGINAIAGTARKTVEASTIVKNIGDLVDSTAKYSELKKQASLGVGDIVSNAGSKELAVVDLANVLGEGTASTTKVIGSEAGEVSFANVSKAYKHSAIKLADLSADAITKEMFDKAGLDKDAIKKYKDTKLATAKDAIVKSATDTPGNGSTQLDMIAKELAKQIKAIGKASKDYTDDDAMKTVKETVRKLLVDLGKMPSSSKAQAAYNDKIDDLTSGITNSLGKKNGLETAVKDAFTFVTTKTLDDAKAEVPLSTNILADRTNNLTSYFKKEANVKNLLLEFVADDKSDDAFGSFSTGSLKQIIKDNSSLENALMASLGNGNTVTNIDDLEKDGAYKVAGPLANLIFSETGDLDGKDRTKSKVNLLGFLALAKKAGAATNVTLATNITKELFQSVISTGKTDAEKKSKLNDLTTKFQAALTAIKLKTGLKEPGQKNSQTDVEPDLEQAAQLSSAFTLRSVVLNKCHQQVVLNREAVVANRVATMINTHIANGTEREETIKIVNTVADALKSVVDANYDDYETVKTKLIEGMGNNPVALSIIDSLFQLYNNNTVSDSNSMLDHVDANQIADEAMTRLNMIATRITPNYKAAAA